MPSTKPPAALLATPESSGVPQDRQFVVRASARLESIEIPPDEAGNQKPKTTGGRWRLNAGSEMVTRVWGINMQETAWGMTPKPIRLVIDFSGLQVDGEKIRCYGDHWWCSTAIAGWWTDVEISEKGVVAALTWFEPKSVEARNAAQQALLLRELVEAGDPMEASLGVDPINGRDDYEAVPADQSVTVNGNTFVGAGTLPLFVLRRGVTFEASLVQYGADRNTGQLAAHALTPSSQDTAPMSLTAARIAALSTQHKGHEAVVLAQLGRENVTDAEIAQAVLAAENTDLKARLAAATATPPPAAPPAGGDQGARLRVSGTPSSAAPTFSGDDDDQAPANLRAALNQLKQDGEKATGAALVRLAYDRWPALVKSRA